MTPAICPGCSVRPQFDAVARVLIVFPATTEFSTEMVPPSPDSSPPPFGWSVRVPPSLYATVESETVTRLLVSFQLMLHWSLARAKYGSATNGTRLIENPRYQRSYA